jgi:SNF2 family DNA or RNA helicase
MPIIVSKTHKSLIVPDTPATRTLAPYAELPPGKLVVRHDIQTTLLLRHMGYKVPSPIMHYVYPGSKQPFKVQRATVEMLIENPHAYVLNAMGTGKTKAALWAWYFLYKAGHVKKLLVIAPLSTLKFVWQREVFMTLPGIKVEILHGTKQDRLDALARDADVYIINTDGIKVIVDPLSTRPDINAIVIDELANFRNNSDRSKLLRKFVKRFEVVWGMTGAPLPNSPIDCWGQAQIVTPHTVPKYQSHCRDMLMTRLSQYVWLPRPNAIEQAYKMMQPAVRFTLDEVVELPELIEREVEVEQSLQQKKVYDKVLKELTIMVADKTITAANAGVAMGKLLQIAGGWVYSQAPAFVRLDASARIAALIDLIQAADQKVIVYVPYRHMIEGIAGIFDRLKLGFDYAVVHGDTKDRENIFNLFQNTDKYHCLLAHPGTISHGLTLTAASSIVWYVPITSLETFEQANARITRVGQKHRQQIIMLQGTPVERRLYSLLRKKQKLQDKFLQLFEEATNAT